MTTFPPPLTISLSPIHIPLLFPLFVYFFHCLLLPLHFPINRSLFLFTNSPIHTPMGRDKPSSFSSPSHIIFSILQYLGFSSLQGGGEGVYTITTSPYSTSPSPSSPCLHSLDYLWSRIQDVASRSSCYSYGVFRLSL